MPGLYLCRDLARKLGATHVLDPNADRGNDLLARIRSLTPDVVPPGRRYAGERQPGPTYVLGNNAGVQALRDLPRFVRLIENGLFDANSLIGQVFRSDKMREALQVAADRSAITSVIDFT